MPEITVVDFDVTRVTNVGIKFQGDALAQIFGELGEIKGETTLATIVKKAEGVTVKSKSTPQSMSLTLSMHVKVDPYRKLFGLSNAGLKPGVYSYGSDSISLPFLLTADALDEFQQLTKKIAFPNCTSDTGLLLDVKNGDDTVAELELKFTAMVDNYNKCYYEARVDELEDATIANQWADFAPDLVMATTTTTTAPTTTTTAG